MFKNQKVLVIGDIMLDCYIDGKVGRISPEAPVPVLSVTSTEYRLGGAGNVVNNITAFGASVTLLSCWGNDAAGNTLSAILEKMNVDTTFIRRYDDSITIQKTRLVSHNHQLFRYDTEKIEPVCKNYVDYLNENLNLFFDGITTVIISDYGKGMITEQTAQLIINGAKQRHIPVLVDPKGSNYSKYRGTTVCKPNLKEFVEITGNVDICSENEILSLGVSLSEKYSFEHLLITRAEKGLSLIQNGRKYDFTAVAQEVTDVTGAGDTVAAVYALGLGIGLSAGECCLMANKAAAIVVSKFGAATVSTEELVYSDKQVISGSSLAKELRRQGKRIVFTNGCFDLVHAGHIKSFEQAKSFGDVLVVGLNSDRSVRSIKGPTRPVISQDDRAKLLCAFSCVDYVVIFDEDTPERLIKEILPDVLVKGADWRGKPVAGQEVVETNGGRIEFIELEQGLSTTSIIDKLKQS